MPLGMSPTETRRVGNLKEWGVLGLLYSLSNCNAEMLRRSLMNDQALFASKSMVAQLARLISDQLHPFMMTLGAGWLAGMALCIALDRRLPRWTFDGPGLWFSLRLVLEFSIISGLIFKTSLVQPGVLLGQIVVFLPFFAITWGWIFCRLDWVGADQPGRVVVLNDAGQMTSYSRFDYFHSTIHTLINKGTPAISGVSRHGKLIVLLFNVMALSLYAVAIARILQLTKASL
jgi:hypothetical protein